MIDITKFIEENTALCVCTLGIAILGYLGYHAVIWIINKCGETEEIDRVAQEIIGPDVEQIVPRQQKIEAKKISTEAVTQNPSTDDVAAIALQTLTIEPKKQPFPGPEAVAQSPNNIQNVQSKGILSSPPTGNYKLTLTLSNKQKKDFKIQQLDDVETLLKIVSEDIFSNHKALEIYFPHGTADREIELRMMNFQKLSTSQNLQFKISHYNNRVIVIEPKPVDTQTFNNKIEHHYANGVIEEFFIDPQSHKSQRIFPDGTIEKGTFHEKSGMFIEEYRLNTCGQIEYIKPEPFASYEEKSMGLKQEFIICDVEDQFVVLEKIFTKDRYIYKITTMPVQLALLKASLRRPFNGDGQKIKPILLHRKFSEHLKPFLEHILAKDESGIPRLFLLSSFSAFDVIESAVKLQINDLSLLKIIHPFSGKNFILHVARKANTMSYKGFYHLLKKCIELFPEEFLSIGQDVIAEILEKGRPYSLVNEIVGKFEQLGGKLDFLHTLRIQVAKATKLTQEFKDAFKSLSLDQKQTLYDSAFIYNNPFIHEPSELPVTADQYSINLMWINNCKMNEDQNFLFGDGETLELQHLDFQEKFVNPVSKWAKANPGSFINTWVDGAMATAKAIEQSRLALEEALQGTPHGQIQFRDVRDIEIVNSNPKAFKEKIPVYFRVDLLRAIVADYTLQKKETQFFVYGDIDMKPLSARKLFDKRTISFLNDYGFVMAKGGFLGFENGFQILNGNHPQFMASHRKVIIDLSIDMALEGRIRKKQEQQIYDTYPAMITHLLDADGRYGKLNVEDREEGINNDSFYRFDRFQSLAHRRLPLGEKVSGEKKIKLKKIMPTKPVNLPPSHFGH